MKALALNNMKISDSVDNILVIVNLYFMMSTVVVGTDPAFSTLSPPFKETLHSIYCILHLTTDVFILFLS